MPMPTAELRQWSLEPDNYGLGYYSLGEVPKMMQGRIYNDRAGISLDGDFVKITKIITFVDHGAYYLAETDVGVIHTYKLLKSERNAPEPKG